MEFKREAEPLKWVEINKISSVNDLQFAITVHNSYGLTAGVEKKPKGGQKQQRRGMMGKNEPRIGECEDQEV